MRSISKQPFLMLAIVILWAAVHSGTVFAQATEADCNGFARVLIKATDSSIVLWVLDPNLNIVFTRSYGPIEGWTAEAIGVGCEGFTRLLWKSTNGAITVWLLDPNLNLVANPVYGPFFGWLPPETLSVDSNGVTRFVWKHTSGTLSLWMLYPGVNFLTARAYGPFFGYEPAAADTATYKSLPKSSTEETPEAKAIAAMKASAGTITTMPNSK